MSLDNESIAKMLDDYEQESRAIKKNLRQIGWHMRGSLSALDTLELTYEDQEIIREIIEEHMEVTEKSRLPYF